jgi:hypothetical protein
VQTFLNFSGLVSTLRAAGHAAGSLRSSSASGGGLDESFFVPRRCTFFAPVAGILKMMIVLHRHSLTLDPLIHIELGQTQPKNPMLEAGGLSL